MTVRTRAQLQTLADTIRTETADDANTVERVGGFLRDLADSCVLPLDGDRVRFLRHVIVSMAEYSSSSGFPEAIVGIGTGNWDAEWADEEVRTIRVRGYHTLGTGVVTFDLYFGGASVAKSVSATIPLEREFILDFELCYMAASGELRVGASLVCGSVYSTAVETAELPVLTLADVVGSPVVRVTASTMNLGRFTSMQIWTAKF